MILKVKQYKKWKYFETKQVVVGDDTITLYRYDDRKILKDVDVAYLVGSQGATIERIYPKDKPKPVDK